MKIEIGRLTEEELIDLNNRIVERLRLLQQMRSHAEMLEFRIGDRVEFQPEGRAPVVGMLTRYNKKTVTVITGLPNREATLRETAAELKRLCGSGGTVINGTVEIQGDHREKVAARLAELGYSVKLAGG